MNDNPKMLTLAVTRMRGGLCVAGMTTTPDPVTHLRWVRPVKPRNHLLLGDIRYQDAGRVAREQRPFGSAQPQLVLERGTAVGTWMSPGDVVNWRFQALNTGPPHVEDVSVNPISDPVRLVRRLDAAQLADFCAHHPDRAPEDVLVRETRSLCLIRPDWVCAVWSQDTYSGHYEARMMFQVGTFTTASRGVPVTDLRWRALGRTWLQGGEWREMNDATLRSRLGDIFLVIGRGRAHEGKHWLLVIGVHAVNLPHTPIDEGNL